MYLYNTLSFSEFYNSISSNKIDITLAYKINKIINAISKDLDFYQTELQKIFEDCVEKDENNNFKMTQDNQNYIIKKDKEKEFKQRYLDLKMIPVVLDDNLKLDLDDLIKLEKMEITPQELLLIQDFLK